MLKKVRNIVSFIGAFLVVFGLLNFIFELVQKSGLQFNNVVYIISQIVMFVLSVMFVHYFFIPPCKDNTQ